MTLTTILSFLVLGCVISTWLYNYYYLNYVYSTAPVNIRFPPQNITDVSFVVQWDAVSNQSIDGYIVSIHQTSNSKHIQTVTVDEISYNVTGLTPDTTYTVTVTVVDESDCNGLVSAGEEVTTTALVLMDTTTVVVSRSPSVDPTVITIGIYKSVPNNVINATINSDTQLVPTLDATVMSVITVIPTVIPTNPVVTTGMFVTINIM